MAELGLKASREKSTIYDDIDAASQAISVGRYKRKSKPGQGRSMAADAPALAWSYFAEFLKCNRVSGEDA